jgi:phosphate-selective porin OprO/OprP
VFNGALDGQNADGDAYDGKDVAGRLFVQPFRGTGSALRGLGFGFAATWGEETGAHAAPAVASYRATGGRPIARLRTGTADSTTALAEGQRLRYAPQAYLYVGPASLLGEVVVSTQAVRLGEATADLTATAWQVVGGYVLTGERAGYGRLRPARALGTDGGLGALEVTARFGVLSFDEDAFPTFASPTASAQRARAWAAGLSWYPTANVRVMANYERTTFALADAAPEGTPALPAEGLFLTRLQVAF